MPDNQENITNSINSLTDELDFKRNMEKALLGRIDSATEFVVHEILL